MIVACARSLRVVPLFLVAMFTASAWAIEPTNNASALRLPDGLQLPDLDVAPSLVTYEIGASDKALPAEVGRFFAENGSAWEVRWDERSGRPHLLQGQGVPMLPGRGNALPARAQRPTLAEVEALCRAFLARYPDLLRVEGLDLRLDASRSIPYGSNDRMWFVELQQYHQGVRVEGANVFFRISHGNLVQFGADRVADVAIDAAPAVSRAQAFANALRTLGLNAKRVSERVDQGTLVIRPVLPVGERIGEPLLGALGQGYAHRLVWDFTFRLAGDTGTYQVGVDAQDGTLLSVADLNMYADAVVDGGVFARSQLTPEFPQGMPFASVTNGTTKTTNAAGVYDYSGGTATVTLNGQFFRMNDNCGTISLSNTTDGNLHLGMSPGTDCSTPGVGGAGNTHSSRAGFYHLTRINRKAATFLSSPWLSTNVQANMNINLTCNAFWNGSTVNFYRSGGGCNNTGEIAAVFLHEWGHGMDTNSGGSAPNDQGSGEAVGDTFAFLETRKACIGENFRATPCHNCSDPDSDLAHRSCTGVRDMAFFSVGGARAMARPSLVTDDNGINCDRFLTTAGAVNCPYRQNGGSGALYRGLMGYEGHCEAVIQGGANWDLAQNLVNRHGKLVGWALMDDIWYGSLTPSKSAYQIVSGGQCNPSAVVNGCLATNWYTVYLPVDDDDGNLANGTPNACRIYAAFDAHGIACGAAPPTCTQ